MFYGTSSEITKSKTVFIANSILKCLCLEAENTLAYYDPYLGYCIILQISKLKRFMVQNQKTLEDSCHCKTRVVVLGNDKQSSILLPLSQVIVSYFELANQTVLWHRPQKYLQKDILHYARVIVLGKNKHTSLLLPQCRFQYSTLIVSLTPLNLV